LAELPMKEKQPPPEDEQTDRPSRTDQARQAAGEYANNLQAILKKLRKRVILKKLRKPLN
jgi:hypothetical protein